MDEIIGNVQEPKEVPADMWWNEPEFEQPKLRVVEVEPPHLTGFAVQEPSFVQPQAHAYNQSLVPIAQPEKSDALPVMSLVLSVIGLLASFVPFLGFIVPIISMIMAIVGNSSSEKITKSEIAIIINSISIAICGMVTFLVHILVQ